MGKKELMKIGKKVIKVEKHISEMNERIGRELRDITELVDNELGGKSKQQAVEAD